MKDPSLKSAPLLACAFIILFASSNKSGINLNAIEIIIASSCTGKWNLFNGFNKLSIASVNSKGFVVEVINVVKVIINTSLIKI